MHHEGKGRELFAQLESEKYISLITFRRDGTPVATPVWFASEDGRLLIWTSATSAKVKRLRRDPHVLVAACDFHGTTHGETYEARASLLEADEGVRVQRLLNQKYGLTKRMLDLSNAAVRIARRRPRTTAAYLEVRPR